MRRGCVEGGEVCNLGSPKSFYFISEQRDTGLVAFKVLHVAERTKFEYRS